MQQGNTSELDAYWLVAHRDLERARRRLLRSNWLKDHPVDGPQRLTIDPPTVGCRVTRALALSRPKYRIQEAAFRGGIGEIDLGGAKGGKFDANCLITPFVASWSGGPVPAPRKAALSRFAQIRTPSLRPLLTLSVNAGRKFPGRRTTSRWRRRDLRTWVVSPRPLRLHALILRLPRSRRRMRQFGPTARR